MAIQKEPTILVIFGCMGDLTWRKLAPALYNLLLSQLLPEKFSVIGLDVKVGSPDDFRQRLRDGANTFCQCGAIDDGKWDQFARQFASIAGDFAAPATYAELDKQTKGMRKKFRGSGQPYFLPGHSSGYHGNHRKWDRCSPIGQG